MAQNTTKLEDILGYKFRNETLLKTALTHSSTGHGYNYERLEFLGDRVLGLVIASLLYMRFPHENEGDLAKRLASLVQGKTLADLAAKIMLGDYINLSDAESASGGAQNEHILADVFEAVIGAMYLDGGFDPCKNLIERVWGDILHVMKKPPQHPKTEAQEWAQSKGLPLPEYVIIGQSGPDHAPEFEVRMIVSGHPDVVAQGKSRAEAEKRAAKLFIEGVSKS